MAAIFILAGGIFGFASALASVMLMNASFMMALAIWSGVGILSLGLGLGVSFAFRRSAVATSGGKTPQRTA